MIWLYVPLDTQHLSPEAGSLQMALNANVSVRQHDAVLDYYGRRLATCSSDKTIKIFEIDGDKHHLQETLKGYSHPKESAG